MNHVLLFVLFFVWFLNFLIKHTNWLHCRWCASWNMSRCWYVAALDMIFRIFYTYIIVIYVVNELVFWYFFKFFFFKICLFVYLFIVRKDIPLSTTLASCACFGIFLAQNVRNNNISIMPLLLYYSIKSYLWHFYFAF